MSDVLCTHSWVFWRCILEAGKPVPWMRVDTCDPLTPFASKPKQALASEPSPHHPDIYSLPSVMLLSSVPLVNWTQECDGEAHPGLNPNS
jgi:hypothetical protein